MAGTTVSSGDHSVRYPMRVDGEPVDHITALDRGLHYGDGLFETLAVVAGEPKGWDAHMRRLRRGCDRLGLPVPDFDKLADEAGHVCGHAERAVLKIIYTRGAGGRGYRLPTHVHPTRVIGLFPWPNYPQSYQVDGVAVRICTTRLGLNPLLAGVKHLNRLEQVLARGEWGDTDIAEGLMLDVRDNVIEGTMSNLFVVKGGVLLTPSLEQSGVAGVTRETILNSAAAMGIEVRINMLREEQLFTADEVFLCNTLIGIWPVRQIIDVREYPVGRVTCQLREALQRY